MSYRDDHDAALHRAEAAERETARLAAETERLTTELAAAREWLGGPKKRALLVGGAVTAAAILVGLGILIGHVITDGPPQPPRPTPTAPLPQVFGVIVGDGPLLGTFTLDATRCVVRDDGIELTQQGSEDHNVWLSNTTVEIESPGGDQILTRSHCFKKLEHAVHPNATTPVTFDGVVDLDCQFSGNRVIGRIEFRHCR